MPDWTYQTVFRPVLRCVPYSAAQSVAFGVMGLLGSWWSGRAVIRLMGHAKPVPDVAVRRAGFELPAPVGLGCGVDIQSRAVAACSLFGFGLIEIGPVYSDDCAAVGSPPTWTSIGIRIPQNSPGISIPQLENRLSQYVADDVQLLIRTNETEVDSLRQIIEVTSAVSNVAGISLPVPSTPDGEPDFERLQILSDVVRDAGRRVFAVVPVRDLDSLVEFIAASATPPPDALIVQIGVSDSGEKVLPPVSSPDLVVSRLKAVRRRLPDVLLFAGGGVEHPGDALVFLNAGADAVLVDSGFTEAGPGLPKRINEAVVTQQRAARCILAPETVPIPHRSWFWCMLLGVSLTLGGLVAVVIGWTRVVLPYDEEFLGMLRDEICGLNDQLLPFMSHDRVTLAGTMLALGPLYVCLAWFGDRRGMHWARVAVLLSSLVGFLSFFTFLGFGYFDPFHAFISAILFQFMALGLKSSVPPECVEVADLENSRAWKRAMWGQLLMVVHGAAVLVAGITISCFGMTDVFVSADLEFMKTTRDALIESNPRLVPLVAHDRASFGGMLMSTGVAVLLSALWGWRRGRRWLWWSLLASGSVAYSTTILIHWWVGYTSLVHLLPAYGGLLFLWLAMLLSRGWMFEGSPKP